MPPPRKRIPPLGPGRRSARQRVLAAWRGVDFEPLEKAQINRARPLAAVVPNVLGDFRIEQRRGDVEIRRVWTESIDPTIVAHAQPDRLHKGTLFVNVDSSVWLSEIVRYRRKEILDRLQHSFGRDRIQRLSFRIG